MKKILCLCLAVILTFSLTGCAELFGGAYLLYLVVTGDNRTDKDEIFTFVSENEDALLTAISNNDFSGFENQGFIKEIDADDTVVEFSCGGAGIGSETSYVGFYYTPNNDMAAVWGAPASAELLTPSGDGFVWQEQHGDNRYYTEHICGNFYYYEASF